MANKPEWVNHNRQTELVKLFVDGGNKCLYGHLNCKILSYYAYVTYRALSVAKPVDKPCFNSDGYPLLDSDGKQLCITVFQNILVHEDTTRFETLYEHQSKQVIKDWHNQDNDDWKAERKAIHSLGEKKLPLRGRFNNISSEIWHTQQPLYYIEYVGMDGLRLQPFARVKLSGSYKRLYVMLGDSLRTVSKHKRRKAIRYGKQLSQSTSERIENKVWSAVKDYLKY